MSPQLPVISGQDAVKALTKAGFRLRRQTGSHLILSRENPTLHVTVPNHRVLDRGTLRSIIRQAGLSVEEFNALL